MNPTMRRNWIPLLPIAGFIFISLIYFSRDHIGLTAILNSSNTQTFKTMFISIILEAFPFILLGVIFASILQVFVTEEMIRRLSPKNPILGIIYACLLGIIFPICECGLIPVVRGLIRKGMPFYIGIVFIIAGPIINPVVFASTFAAFRNRPEIVYSRMGLAFIVAAIIGLIIYYFVKQNPLKSETRAIQSIASHDHHEHHEHEKNEHGHALSNRFFSILRHASDEFFEMGKYLVLGSFITAIVHTFVARETLFSIGQGELSSHLFMMGFAYILSICSTSDAFVASSFISTFSTGSILSFLVFGAMLDFKTTLMLLSSFKTRFVIVLALLLVVVSLIVSIVYERLVLLS